MKWFRQLYVWALNTKLFMAFYFFMIVFAVGVLEVVVGGDSLKLIVLLEMTLACIVIGLLQVLLLNDSVDYAKGMFFGRSVAWLTLSTVSTGGMAVLFGWFSGYPAWSLPAFTIYILFMLIMTLLGFKFEQEADTVHLNENLRKFKEKQ